MKSTLFHEYKAAIALNNIGVTLLGRCRYTDALVSFQSGFILMNSSIKDNISNRSTSFACFNHDDNGMNEISTNQSRFLPQEMLHQASRKLAQSATVKTSRSHDESSGLMHPIILTADKTSNSILDVLNLKHSTNSCYAIRIDDDGVCEFDETVPVTDYMMEIAIILNNIGTVYRCYASNLKASSLLSSTLRKPSVKKSNKKFKKLVNSGLSFCTAARRILATMADVESTEDEIKRQGLLSLLIFDNLMNLSNSIRDIVNSQQYYIEYGDLRSMLLTTFFTHDVGEGDDSANNDVNNSGDKGGSRFYVENELFYVTGAGAA